MATASVIRVKRSSGNGGPSTLYTGELAYSFGSSTKKLYVGGIGTDGLNGDDGAPIAVGGEFYTSLLEATAGTVTASKALIVDASSKLDILNVDDLTLNGNVLSSTGTLKLQAGTTNIIEVASNNVIAGGAFGGSQLFLDNGNAYLKQVRSGNVNLVVGANDVVTSTLTFNNDGSLTVPGTIKTLSNADLTLAPNGSGSIVLDGQTWPTSEGADGYFLKTSTGGILSWAAIPSGSFTVAGDTGTDAFSTGETLTFTGGTGITSAVTANTVTFDVDNTVALRADTQYIGTTAVTLNRTSANLALTGILSVALPGATSGTITLTPTAVAGTNILTLPAATDTLVGKDTTDILTNKTISGASNTLSNIGNSSLTNSSVTIGSTEVSLGSTVATFAGLTSITSTTFVGALTGNASTATTLATARNINGVSFNGSADITVTADAGTLTGTTLNSTVVTSSLTSVGTIGTGVWQGTAVAVAYGGTGTATGSITGTGALTFTAGGTNTNVNLAPQGDGTVDVNSKRITGVATPTADTDAANKAYVDATKSGLDVKQSARVATNAALTTTYDNGTATLTNAGVQAALTIDSIPLSLGDRVLVKNQAAALQNGIYTVSTVGTAGTNWILTRATDFDSTAEVTGGAFTFIEEGTDNADNGYVVTTNGTITIGTTAIDWVQFSGAGQITAGNGLTKTGNTLNVGAGDGITVNADTVALATTTAGDGLTYTSGVLAVVGTTNRISVTADAVNISTDYVGQTSITTVGALSTGSLTTGFTAVNVAQGGTGAITFTSKGLLYGNGTDAVQATAEGTNGYVLYSNAGTPAWTNIIDGGTYVGA